MELEVHPLMKYKHRLFLLEELPKNSICAEIGVFEGTFSQKILEICNPKLLHLIDPCLNEKFYYNEKFLKGNFIVHKTKFEHTKFKNEYFDWVYLDADHKFPSTLKQLELCYKKTKKFGLITGDDYNENFNHKNVIISVGIFLRKYKEKVELEYIKNWQYKIRKIK